MSKIKIVLFVILITALLTSVWFLIRTEKTSAGLDEFAQCLAEKGTTMYGTRTCPYCLMEKNMFGDAFKYINYVECLDEPLVCIENGIEAVPVWEIDGEKYLGARGLKGLSEISGCPLNLNPE